MKHDPFREILETVEPLDDRIYGPRYRCSVRLKDGTHLPCVVLQSKQRLLRLAKRRLSEEEGGRQFDGVLSSFVAERNRLSEYEVESATASRYALPRHLLDRIHSETSMGWTGWVFEMNDGRLFSYGSTFSMEFFHLPDGYEFTDVREVHNHSYVDADGAIAAYRQPGGRPPAAPFRERSFFVCAVRKIQ